MQFVMKGPDIPDALLEAHEDGRVVFFCGAGISYPAGLPGFKGLVDDIYRRLGTSRTPIEQDAYDRAQFDATLDLLERRVPGQRIAVRTALTQTLQPKLRRKGATDTHAALLQLARCREGSLRLVTTNFDRVFEYIAKRTKQSCGAYAAPMLPIPKNSRWNGVVYLHGMLGAKNDDSTLNRLVLTSGDFGLAYLTERWAARFVGELFRNYVVCFVGYSINDPVLRYMMDALAADRMLGEASPQAYALGDSAPGEEHAKTIEWEAKGVTPILYEVPKGSNNHSTLHKTLKAWAETYRDGVLGKERIVVNHALARPAASTRQDDFVGRMLWSLSHESGLPAKRLAEHNPVPPLEWLEAFSETRYQQSDLKRFGVAPNTKIEDKLRFSLVHRPASYQRAPWMALVSGATGSSQWDAVMFQLARWLVRHLNDPTLIIWLAQKGGRLHERWPWLIEHELDRFAQLELEGKAAELNEIRSNAPNAIPSVLMQTLWRLLLTGRIKSPQLDTDLYHWRDRFKRDGLTTTLRLELRELLSPKVAVKNPVRWGSSDHSTEALTQIKQLVDWELVLTADHVHSWLNDIAGPHWSEALPALLGDFQLLLRDALDLLRELGEADNHSDRSHWDMPSISPHWQNRKFHDWVTLIELLRDAWLALQHQNSKIATRIAEDWFDLPYPTFKRLALFAASQEECIAPELWVNWLLIDRAWWLWSMETRRETSRLLVLQGNKITPLTQGLLEAAILAGPPRDMYVDDIGPDYWDEQVDRSVWLNLAKLGASGLVLRQTARDRMTALTAAHPEWRLDNNERDEFSLWMSGSGDPDYEDSREISVAPRSRHELTLWLKQPQSERSPFHEDTWRETCRTRFFHCLYALCDLAKEGFWPKNRWREALQAWSEEGRVSRSWRYAAPLVETMPDDVLRDIVNSVTWWLDETSKSIEQHRSIFFSICHRVLDMQLEARSGITLNGQPINQPVTEAINHPIGHVAQALLNFWLKGEPNDNDKLPIDIEPFFTRFCDGDVARFRHARVLLASRLIALFRVDRAWTVRYLLPFFNWDINATEARSTWEGFLWSPRLYRPLLITFKSQFLETAHHYNELGECRRQFSAILTYAALEPVEGYTAQDYQTAFGSLPQEGLEDAAQALSQALDGAGDQREDYWQNRVHPFWRDVWPKSRDLASNRIAESLARLAIAARASFPAALAAVLDWLRPIEHPHYIVHLLEESHLCAQYPVDALKLLNTIIDNQMWGPRELGKCLGAIAQSAPELLQDARFQRLRDYSRQHGT